MALLSARTTRFVAAFILACVCALPACSQAVVAPGSHPDPTVQPLSSPITPQPTQNQPTTFFKGPLSVTITRPLDNDTVQTSPVEITGQADPGTVVTIDDNVILVDSTQAFSSQLVLEPGANLIEITASDANENQGFAYLTLFYEPQP
jgi:hypothetical protein